MSEREARDAEWERLHVEERWTLTDIGRKYGVTREWVRQVLRKRGVPQEVTREVLSDAAMPEERRACIVCGGEHWRKPYDRRVTCGAPACVSEAVGSKRQYSGEELLEHLRELADDLGCTPSSTQINAADGPSHMTYVYWFGGVSEAQRLAGLEPNSVGGGRR